MMAATCFPNERVQSQAIYFGRAGGLETQSRPPPMFTKFNTSGMFVFLYANCVVGL